MVTRVGRTLAAVVLAAVLAPAADAAVMPAGRQAPQGLWQTDMDGDQVRADCAGWPLDDNGFCVANDARNGLEVGVKFRASSTVQITGIRIYRVDTATLRASLWEADGTLLARGTFPDSGGHRWQDMRFPAPVTIVPGRTYVASYFTPSTKYAFEYWYFQRSGRTVGPVTALRSVDGDPNGVHCYDEAACGSFPVRPHKDSSYFVSPLWVATDATATDPATDPTADPTTDPSTGGSGSDTDAPRVVALGPRDGAERVRAGTNVTVRFSTPVRAASLTRATVRLRRSGSSRPVRAVLRPRADGSRVVIDPRSRLRARTTYRVVVTSDVRDAAGNRLDQAPNRAGLQGVTATFRTR